MLTANDPCNPYINRLLLHGFASAKRVAAPTTHQIPQASKHITMSGPNASSHSLLEYVEPCAVSVDLLTTISQLTNDREPVVIHTRCSYQSYPVQKTWLATVSDKLAESCQTKHVHLPVEHEAFLIFLDWLFHGNIELVAKNQRSLAMA